MEKYYAVDLHCHTTASDGLHTPAEVVEIAHSLGLKGIGITDHDTIAGWEEAEAAGKRYGIRVVKGLEVNTELNGTEIHILGYEFDPTNDELVTKLNEMQQARFTRIERIIAKLNQLGIDIHLDEILDLAQGGSIGRPHVAQVLVNKGYAVSVKDAFQKYIMKGAPAYVERYKMSPETAIRLIRGAGGVAVLAHPGTIQEQINIRELCRAGLQGIEVVHSDHPPEDVKRFMKLAQKYGLIPTGGSDFHGEGRKPGVMLGHWGTSVEIMEYLLSLSRKYCPYYEKDAK